MAAFTPTTTEVHSADRNSMLPQTRNIFYLALYRKKNCQVHSRPKNNKSSQQNLKL